MARKCRLLHICPSKRGFTLIETAIITAIIAVLAVLAVNYYSNYVEEARTTLILSNLKLLNEAISRYHKEHNMAYPKYIDLELSLTPYLNRPISEIIKQAERGAEGMKTYYLVSLPYLRGGVSGDVHSGLNGAAWKTSSELAIDLQLNRYFLSEIAISATRPGD